MAAPNIITIGQLTPFFAQATKSRIGFLSTRMIDKIAKMSATPADRENLEKKFAAAVPFGRKPGMSIKSIKTIKAAAAIFCSVLI